MPAKLDLAKFCGRTLRSKKKIFYLQQNFSIFFIRIQTIYLSIALTTFLLSAKYFYFYNTVKKLLWKSKYTIQKQYYTQVNKNNIIVLIILLYNSNWTTKHIYFSPTIFYIYFSEHYIVFSFSIYHIIIILIYMFLKYLSILLLWKLLSFLFLLNEYYLYKFQV